MYSVVLCVLCGMVTMRKMKDKMKLGAGTQSATGTKSVNLCPPLIGWLSYTPRHWVFFCSSLKNSW